MQIREAKSSDREQIVALDSMAENDPLRVKFIDRSLRFETCLVAENAGRLIGYAVLEYSFYSQGFVSMVYVAEPDRRRGIGRKLLQALELRCNTSKLFTSTNESNHPMRALLTSLGYVPSGVIHNLDPGDPELVFFQGPEKRAS